MAQRKQRRKIMIAGRYCRAIQYTMLADPDVSRSRAPKTSISSCARETLNLRHSWQKLKAAIAANFSGRDLVVTLSYADCSLPPTREAAEKRLKLFIRRLRAARREFGHDLRYMYVTEKGHSSGRLHHHIILNATGDDYDLVRRLWSRDGDNIDFARVADKGFDGWADYLTKEPREIGRRYVGERMWRASRGLVKPSIDAGWVDANAPLEPPLGSFVMERQSVRNGFGSFEFLEYLLPENQYSVAP